MLKRTFDFVVALVGIVLLSWLLLLIFIILSLQLNGNAIFKQIRIGRFAKPFTIYKFRTMHRKTHKINAFSKFLRDSKIDELPQLINVIKGDMSLVGPRPDIPGYYDKLEGEARKILELRPGITSLASLKYRNEEQELATYPNPLQHNDEVLFPDKIKMNLAYYYNRSFWTDVKILFQTLRR